MSTNYHVLAVGKLPGSLREELSTVVDAIDQMEDGATIAVQLLPMRTTSASRELAEALSGDENFPAGLMLNSATVQHRLSQHQIVWPLRETIETACDHSEKKLELLTKLVAHGFTLFLME